MATLSGAERLASAERALDKVEAGLKIADTVLKLCENSGLPLLPAICSAARGVLEVVLASQTVIKDALSVAQRTIDVLELLQLMAQNVKRMDVSSRARVEDRMRELQRLLEDVRLAVDTLGKQGWLRHMLNVGRRTTLSQLDLDITDQLNLLLKFYNLARDADILDRLQARKYAVEAEVERQVAERKALGEAVDEEALEKDSEVVRGIAVASGVSDAEFRSELCELGAEVQEAFEKHGLKLDKVLELNQRQNLKQDQILEMVTNLSMGGGVVQSTHSSRLLLYAYDRKPDAPSGQKDKLAARLGKGSFGVTYRMRKVAGIDARRYAVKMIESEELDGTVLEKEARLLSMLEHENLLRFYDAFWHDTDDSRYYVIVTELLTGGSLVEKIAAAPPPHEVAALMRQVSSGLSYVHSLNLQHRDVKPANVMLDSTGRVKIIDFGLACVSSASRSRSRTKVGTDAYMSPEKADGKRYGPPDDVWAAGCILAELLLGRPIGNVARDQTKMKRAIAESTSASERLGSWVEGCLQEIPGRRPAAAVLEQGLASGGPDAHEAEERRLREAAAAAAAADEKERVRREAVDRSRREAEEERARQEAVDRSQREAEEERSRRAALSKLAALGKPSDAALCRLFRNVGGSLEGALKRDRLNWSSKSLDAADASVVAYIVSVSAVLTYLNLGYNQIRDEGAAAIAEAMRGNAVLKTLILYQNNIGDEGAKAIGKALEVNEVLKSVDLRFNRIGDEGAKALASVLRVNAALSKLNLDGHELDLPKLRGTDPVTSLDLSNSGLGPASAIVIASMIEGNEVLTELDLSSTGARHPTWNEIGDEGAAALASALRVNGVLTSLDVGSNGLTEEAALGIVRVERQRNKLTSLGLARCGIGPAGAAEIAEYVSGSGVLTFLNLGRNNIGDEGAKALAAALRVNGVLKRINLIWNLLGDEGNKVIRDAVGGRAGFELKM